MIPKASVVIVNLNQGKFLKECLDSVVKQTYPNIEILVMDGESQDNSLNILKEYPLVSWISEPDNSSGHAFAKGVKIAQGEVVFFLTSTDGYVDEEWIAKAMIEFYENPELSLVAADVLGVSATSVLNGYKWPVGALTQWDNQQVFMSWLLNGNGTTPITFGVREKVLRRCAPVESRMGDPRSASSVDFFWYFFGEFFKSRFIAKKLNIVSSFVRFHDDRVDDVEYLKRQQHQLHRIIIENRRKILLERKSIDFIDSNFEVLSSYRIRHRIIVFRVLKFKLISFVNFLLKPSKFIRTPLARRILRRNCKVNAEI